MSSQQQIVLIAAVLGALALWLMLPRGHTRLRVPGAVLGVIALGILASLVPPLAGLVARSVFWMVAGTTVISAAATVATRSPVYAAIWFGLMLVGVAGLFLFQGAQFLAVATLVVYAGAILVTFLFVLMLAQPRGRAAYDRVSWEALGSSIVAAALVGVLSLTVASVLSRPAAVEVAKDITRRQRESGILMPEHVAKLGSELFGRHLIAVEAAGVLLLAALVGAAVIVAQGRAGTPGPARPEVDDRLSLRESTAAPAERKAAFEADASRDGRRPGHG